jgi:hypothetical protein
MAVKNKLTVKEREILRKIKNKEPIVLGQYDRATLEKCLNLLQSKKTYYWVDFPVIDEENQYFLDFLNGEKD